MSMTIEQIHTERPVTNTEQPARQVHSGQVEPVT